MNAVLDQLMKTEDINSFISIVSRHRQAFPQVIEFLRNNHSDLIEKFLQMNNLDEELFFLYLEIYFQSNNIKNKTVYLENAKSTLKKLLDKDKEEWKFYQSYLNDLEHSIYFKKECMEENYIKPTDTGSFDRPVMTFYSEMISVDKYGFVEGKNKQWFDISSKKLSTLRMKAYSENQNIEAIKVLNIKLKVPQSCYISFAEICIDNKLNDLVYDFLKKANNEDEEILEYKLSLLKHIEKYVDAAEMVISNDDCERKEQFIDDLRSRDPSIEPKIREFCARYKVNLGY